MFWLNQQEVKSTNVFWYQSNFWLLWFFDYLS